jgi:hypothetical protein
MIRNNIFTRALIGVLVVALAAPLGALAQNAQSNVPGQTFSRAELDQMLAPIALYPDSMLAQILIAATYPSQVVEADRWVKENKGLSKDQLNAALDEKDWDLSVKALVPFPQVLAMMDEQLDWTTKLGEAFLAQQKEVMASIQGLRQKAYAQGNLKTTEQQKVTVAGEDIEIGPANPDVVYVPYYDPLLVYGDWWWPDYPPFAYYPYGEPFITLGLFGWLAAVSVGPYWNWGWGYWNWGGGNCFVNVNRTVNINDPNLHMRQGHFRTEGFHQFAHGHGVGTGRTGGRFGAGRTVMGARPSTASVVRGLSHGGTALTRGGAHGTNLARGGTHGTNLARGGTHGANFARGGASHFGSAPHFGGGVPAFGGHGFAGIGGAPHFGGGAFGGGAPHFGGGGFGGGFHGGGGGFHGGGGGGFHGGGGGRR